MSEEERRYQQLADEARVNAATASDSYDKRTLLLVAQRYEILAERARLRANGQRAKSA